MNIGRLIAAVILAKDTILLKLKTVRKMPRQVTPTGQEMPRSIPKPVATAFPPFHPSQIGHMCPMIAKRPVNTCHLSSRLKAFAIRTALTPLNTSHENTKRAGHLPTSLKTLVAPVDPEPLSRKSIFAKYLPAR